jgi:hypothetical protein
LNQNQDSKEAETIYFLSWKVYFILGQMVTLARTLRVLVAQRRLFFIAVTWHLEISGREHFLGHYSILGRVFSAANRSS